MTKISRKRKKWLKQHNKYVNPRDTWNLDYTIAEYVLPRLKLFNQISISYPGRDEMDTAEKWHNAIDKMITAFQLVIDTDDLHDRYWDDNFHFNQELFEKDQAQIKEGLHLFAEWFQHLWW